MKQRNRGDSFYKIWEVLKPFVVFYVTYNVAFLLIIYLCNAVMEYFGGGLQAYVKEHGRTLTELVSGVSMLIGVIPLVPMLRQELSAHRDQADKAALPKTAGSGNDNREVMSGEGKTRKALTKAPSILITVILAMSSSVALNVLLSLTGLVQASESYRDVADHQYSVAIGVGAVLFGLISPIAEEIVFRGLIFNRMRRYYPTAAAIVASGVLFGVYHGNLVQGLYGGCMGMLLAYTYERMGSFFFPCLFHAAANLTVYMLTYAQALYPGLQGAIFTVPGCTMLLIVSAGCIFITERLWKRNVGLQYEKGV